MPLRAHIALFVACFFWAISFIATKKALDSIPPLTVVMLRLVISAVCFLIWLKTVRRKLSFGKWRWWIKVFVISLAGGSMHYGLQTVGLQMTSASNASLYAVSAPISIMVLSVMFLGEKISPQKIVGLLIAVGGVLTVMGWHILLDFKLTSHIQGDLLVLSSILMWGLFTVLSKRMTSHIRPLELTAIITIVAAVTMIPVGCFESATQGLQIATVSAEAWIAVAFLGVTCSFLAVLLYIYALKGTQSQKVGIYLYTIPPMTYFFAAFYLGEPITQSLIVGSVLVMTGVFLTERG